MARIFSKYFLPNELKSDSKFLFMTALIMYILSICPCLPIHQYKAFFEAPRYSLLLSSDQNPLKSRSLLSTNPQANFHSCFIHLSKLPLDVTQQCTYWYSYMGFCTLDILSIYQCQIHHFKVPVIWCIRYLNHISHVYLPHILSSLC